MVDFTIWKSPDSNDRINRYILKGVHDSNRLVFAHIACADSWISTKRPNASWHVTIYSNLREAVIHREITESLDASIEKAKSILSTKIKVTPATERKLTFCDHTADDLYFPEVNIYAPRTTPQHYPCQKCGVVYQWGLWGPHKAFVGWPVNTHYEPVRIPDHLSWSVFEK